ncbi:endolytic transglycosylase MltG [Brevundimonas sp. UBA2416]|uniref:endolytic transglycosylase MltG n=1 Tax=Brevundimonas sp. UBA2416 TaxID=1946124 RepID=UPI0025BC9486|nr:endolytic transglycosylase MltG [Brevundimonas sp. UBA2416]
MSVERRSGRKTAFLAATATFSTFLIIALIAAWSVFYAPGPAAREGESTVVSLPSGAGVSAIAATLKSAGVIRSTDMFKAAATLTGADRKLRAGEYEVPSKASLRSVLVLLVEGRVVRHYVTLPEGWSSAQAVEILNNQTILTGTIDAVPEEASLWPDTYEISRGETRASVIARMRRARDENLARLWAARGSATVVRTPEEAMILASIVEKETGVAHERPRVAAVFTNRLRAGMRLESDPTIEYGLTRGVPLRRGLRRSELDRPNPWNTYQIDGLPPTAISNPGRDAVAAVLNPPSTADIFFVADGSGGHAFARTYEEHLANVARWREIERRRAGPPPAAPEPAPAAPDAAAPASDGVPPGVTVSPGARVIAIPAPAPAG